MTIDDFRRIALSMPGAEELNGMGYANFRVERMSFATMEDAVPVIRLTRDQQATYMATAPEMFAPASDGWGKRGSTIVRLEAADEATLRDALTAASRNVTNGATTAADVNDVTYIDVLDAGANVAGDVADVDEPEIAHADTAEVPDDANQAVADMARGPDRPADVAAAVRAAAMASCEPRDDLQHVIEQLQEYCRQKPAR